jgi:hypothetical protein
MPQPARLPLRRDRVSQPDSVARGGWVIKDAAGVIVGYVLEAKPPEYYDALNTADLLVAGANHLPRLLQVIGDNTDILCTGVNICDALEKVSSALKDADDLLAVTVSGGTIPAADAASARAKIRIALEECRRGEDMMPDCRGIIEAFTRADRDCPSV